MTPDLTLQNVDYGSTEIVWDLAPLLYKYGSAVNVRKVNAQITSGKLGKLNAERLRLVIRFHDVLSAKLEGGGSRYTVRGKITHLRNFYTWGDSKGYHFDEQNVAKMFLEWTEHLLYRSRIQKTLSHNAAHGLSSGVGSLIEETIEVMNLTTRSRVKKSKKTKQVLGSNADKQLLSKTFEFGRFLLTIVESLTCDKIRGRLPLIISFEGGAKLEEWAGLRAESSIRETKTSRAKPSYLVKQLEKRERRQTDSSWRTRHPLINLRIEAELLIFISQTGVNLAQAQSFNIGSFRYASHNGGYLVKRVHKARAGGEVEFEIYCEYRVIFERYLAWRKEFFSDGNDNRMFPLKTPKCDTVKLHPNFERVKERCDLVGVPYFGPRELRKTRVNWLIRRTQNTKLVAEMAQNTETTLLASYERPHHQRAVLEITKFNIELQLPQKAPGPGLCAKTTTDSPTSIDYSGLEPNCVNPAGCLFCSYHRDIESFDHVWSLKTYQRYQIELLTTHRANAYLSGSNPVELTIKRIGAKIKALEHSGAQVRQWIEESEERVNEGYYHPQWDMFIRILEIK